MPNELLGGGAAISVMGAALIVAIKALGRKKEGSVICAVNTNGFKATLEAMLRGQDRQTSILEEMARDIAVLKDRTKA